MRDRDDREDLAQWDLGGAVGPRIDRPDGYLARKAEADRREALRVAAAAHLAVRRAIGPAAAKLRAEAAARATADYLDRLAAAAASSQPADPAELAALRAAAGLPPARARKGGR